MFNWFDLPVVKENKGKYFINKVDLQKNLLIQCSQLADGQKSLFEFMNIAEKEEEKPQIQIKKPSEEISQPKKINSIEELNAIISLPESEIVGHSYLIGDLEMNYEDIIPYLKEANPRDIENMKNRLINLKQINAIRDLRFKIFICSIISEWETRLVIDREWSKVSKTPLPPRFPMHTIILKKGNEKILLQDILPELLKLARKSDPKEFEEETEER